MEDFIPTRASQIKRDIAHNYISINYETSRKKSRLTDGLRTGVSSATVPSPQAKQQNNCLTDAKTKTIADLKKKQEIEMKKIRYDVIKFGMSGFEKVKARKAKNELAITLGAVPPKKRGMNYKVLKKRQKVEKEKKKEVHMSGFANSLLKPKSKKVHKKDSGILGVYGKVPKGALSRKQKN